MGCNHSRTPRPHLFKASNLNEHDKTVRSVYLEDSELGFERNFTAPNNSASIRMDENSVHNSTITVQSRSGKLMATWPLQCIRRYGVNDDGALFIEAGNGCDTGQGMYLFKCERNEEVFELLKKSWAELQGDQASMLRSSLPFTIPVHNTALPPIRPQDYVNSSPTSQYINGDVRAPLPTPTNQSPPPRGSTSSQHTGPLPSLPEDSPLIRPFPLQPAPTSRKEMIIRRRINSEAPAAFHQRPSDKIRPNSADYQNNEVNLRVLYKKKSDQVTLPTDAPASAAVSNCSIRSDCELLLTPNSKSSGVGSMNGNPPPPVPPLCDPWRRHPAKFKHPGILSCGPLSARDYVNTMNASLDVAGTPLPATAIGGVHFSFDFEPPSRRVHSSGLERSTINYVPVDCGASSTSSGINGTPRSPKTPRTPLLSNTEYTEIDHKKTRALSHTGSHRARQRVKRHTNTELAVINAL